MKKIIRWIIKNSKVDGINLLIYIIGLIISVSLIALSFIFSSENNWRAIFGGTGASGIGAVLLGYFIERANNCRLEKEKLRTREKLVSAIDSDIVQIMCHEVLLLEKEQNEFFCSTKGKTLYDIIEDVEKIYNEQIISNALSIKDTEIFNENHKSHFEIRNKIICRFGNLINYTVNDIYQNRSYNVNSGLFTDNEIKDLVLLQCKLEKIKNSEDYEMYIMSFCDFIFASKEICLLRKNNVLDNTKRTDDGFVGHRGYRVIVHYESWINDYEIQI